MTPRPSDTTTESDQQGTQAMMGPTVIIGDLKAAAAVDDRGGRPTPEDTAAQHLGLQDLTACLRGQPSNRPPQPGSTESGIGLCYADPAHVEVTRTRYLDMPSKATGQFPLEVQVKVFQVPPTLSGHPDQDDQPCISPPEEDDTHKWMAYYRVEESILSHDAEPALNLAMREAAAACGLHERHHHEQESTTPHQDLRSMVSAIWRDRRDLHMAIHLHDPHTQQSAPGIVARLKTTRRQLREWHESRANDLAQEQQRYLQDPKPYKALKHVDTVLGATGQRCIKAVRLQDGTVTNDPSVVMEEVLSSFKRQHNTEDGELSNYSKKLTSHLPTIYNRTQRHHIHRTPFTIRELDEVLHKLMPGRNRG